MGNVDWGASVESSYLLESSAQESERGSGDLLRRHVDEIIRRISEWLYELEGF